MLKALDTASTFLINYIHDNKGSLAMKAGMVIALCVAYRALTLALLYR